MCAKAGDPPASSTLYFHPQVKCCTYLPRLPNFLVGRLLADDDPDFAPGRITVEERLQRGVAVTPLGLGRDDEGPRRDTSLEHLAKLPPVFKPGGTVTAGNSSPLNDGAAALPIVSAPYARAHGLKSMARIGSVGVAGVPPRVMGIGPVPATRKALSRGGIILAEVGLIELNEAFAAQALAVLYEWGMDPEDERLNPNGGAIALGHPLGCFGARILTTLLHEMERHGDVELGLATMCIGVEQGIALLVEKV